MKMKKEMQTIIFAIIVAGISFVLMMTGFNNDPHVLKIIFIVALLIVVPLSLLMHSIYLITQDRKTHTPYFVFFATYNILLLNGLLVMMIWNNL